MNSTRGQIQCYYEKINVYVLGEWVNAHEGSFQKCCRKL